MARIEQRRQPAERGPASPLVWRGVRAAGSTVTAPLIRLLRRVFVLALVILIVVLFVRSIGAQMRTPGTPTRVVAPSDGARLSVLRQAGDRTVRLEEGDLTFAFQRATALPTFPFRDGQVVLRPGLIEVFGRLKASVVTVRLEATPAIDRGELKLTLTRVDVGVRQIPRFLYPLAKVPTLDQASLFTNALTGTLQSVDVQDRFVTLQLQ